MLLPSILHIGRRAPKGRPQRLEVQPAQQRVARAQRSAQNQRGAPGDTQVGVHDAWEKQVEFTVKRGEKKALNT